MAGGSELLESLRRRQADHKNERIHSVYYIVYNTSCKIYSIEYM